jgi:uncharacterized membrane protein
MSLRKLKAWEAAGLIDPATAARIRDWEMSNAHPVAMRAVIGIAALAIGLGLISVVAANWDAVEGVARLGIHFALMAGLAFWLWRKAPASASGASTAAAAARGFAAEAGLFVLGMLGLTFFGHIGQVYQTDSPLWQPLALWLALFAPAILLLGTSRLNALLLITVMVVTAFSVMYWMIGLRPRLDRVDETVLIMLALTSPLLLAGLAAWALARSGRPGFWRRLAELASVYAAVGASIAAIASADGPWRTDEESTRLLWSVLIASGVTLITALMIRASRRDPEGRIVGNLWLGLAAVPLICYALSGSKIVAALLFMALWAGIAFAALRAGWRSTFQAAVGLIALRLVLLSFELGGDLLTSGAGLIVSGLLMLGIAWLALKISKRFAPPAGPPSGSSASQGLRP